MKVDVNLSGDLATVGESAHAIEASGYAGLLSAETGNDPFLPLSVAALQTERIDLITSIAVAFARTPMALAYVAHDLQQVSRGRFILGLGSQIRAHIQKRFSMPWSQPAARMREYICALRAIWNSWYTNEPLKFVGEFYTHTLMTPFFSPVRRQFPPPRIYLAAVGPRMTEVAGELADGLIVHPFTTQQYFQETILPALKNGWKKASNELGEFEICYPVFVLSGSSQELIENAKSVIRQQLAFYGSTPAYKAVLASVGYDELQPQLNRLAKQGLWNEMSSLITDDVFDYFVVQANPDKVATTIINKFNSITPRISLLAPGLDEHQRSQIVAELVQR